MGETQPGTRLLLALPSFCQLGSDSSSKHQVKNLLDKRKKEKKKRWPPSTIFAGIISLSYTSILGSLSYTGMLGLTGT